MKNQCATVKIRLDDLDRMNDLFREVFVLTYLSDLVLVNIEDKLLCDKDLSSMDRFAPLYLMEKQVETVSQLDELLHMPGFTTGE